MRRARSFRLASCVAVAACAVAMLASCKKEEARPPATNDPVNQSGGNGAAPGDGGGTLGDGGGSVLADLGVSVRHVASDANTVFATLTPVLDVDAGTDAGAAGSIVALPKSGAAPVTIESGGAPDVLLVVGSQLVFSDVSGAPGQAVIYRAPLTGGTASAVAQGLEAPIVLTTDGTNVFFASGIVGSSGVTVDRAPLGGGASQNVTTIPGELTASGVTTDGSNVYVAVKGLAGGEVLRVPAGGGGGDVIWSHPSIHPAAVAFASGTVFIAAGATGTDGSLIAVHVAAPASTTTLASGSYTPTAMALGPTSAYVTAISGGAGVLARFPLGGGDPTTLASDIGSPVDVVVDDAAYVGTSTRVLRVAK